MPPRNQPHHYNLPCRREAEPSLYASDGKRKYLNAAERQRVLAAMRALPVDRALFALTLAWTGARVSEVLALTAASFQLERSVVAIRTLKRRRHVVREVPIPPELMSAIDRHFALRHAQPDPTIPPALMQDFGHGVAKPPGASSRES